MSTTTYNALQAVCGMRVMHVPELQGTTVWEMTGQLICSTRAWLQLSGDEAGLIAYDWERLVQLQTWGTGAT